MRETIAVWFSCGAASAVAAQKTIEQYGGTCDIRVLNNPVMEEDVDNRRFLNDVESWLGIEVEIVSNHKYPISSAEQVWENREFMAGREGAPCTLELKKMARQQWEMDNDCNWHVLGFTADEERRFCNFQQRERQNTLPVLIEHGITKADCYRIVQDAGLDLPAMYHLGFPNANCIGCPKASSATYWSHVREKFPEVYARRAEMSRRLGARLVRYKGNRMFLDELPEGAKGRPMKNLDFECGVFCHTGEDD